MNRLVYICYGFLAIAATSPVLSLRLRRDNMESLNSSTEATEKPQMNDTNSGDVFKDVMFFAAKNRDHSSIEEEEMTQESGQRRRRDVSHLNLEYLPPTTQYLQPGFEYLQPVFEYLPPVDEGLNQERKPAVSNQYLPPDKTDEEEDGEDQEDEGEKEDDHDMNQIHQHKEEMKDVVMEEEQEKEQDKKDSNEDTHQQAQPVLKMRKKAKKPAVAVTTETPTNGTSPIPEVPQDSAILADDGYHYRKPASVPQELLPGVLKVPDTRAYLPPFEYGADDAASSHDRFQRKSKKRLRS